MRDGKRLCEAALLIVMHVCWLLEMMGSFGRNLLAGVEGTCRFFFCSFLSFYSPVSLSISRVLFMISLAF